MKHTETPLVSIVMATYNRANVLTETIENIFAQDYRPLELIIINDGSIDNTMEVLSDLQKTFEFKIIHNHKNLKLQKSLNRGIKEATGKYIARVDDHDKWIKKDKLTKQVEYLEEHTEVGLLGTAYRLGERTMQNPLSDREIRHQMLLRSPFCHVTVLMRSAPVKAIGGYDEKLPYSEDWDLWLKMGMQCRLANLAHITVAVTEEEISLSKDFFLRQIPLNYQLIQKYLNVYPGKIKAICYHRLIHIFFSIVPLEGRIHRRMKKVFHGLFL